jgi:hypothetical protein
MTVRQQKNAKGLAIRRDYPSHFLRKAPTMPSSPVPTSSKLPGSGVAAAGVAAIDQRPGAKFTAWLLMLVKTSICVVLSSERPKPSVRSVMLEPLRAMAKSQRFMLPTESVPTRKPNCGELLILLNIVPPSVNEKDEGEK